MPTPESSLESLANRVTKLETQNRRLKKAGIALSILVGAVIAMGQIPAKKVIEANEFVLKDADGKTRALLEVTEGSAALMLYGPQGSNQLGSMSSIAARPNGGIIALTDRNGKNRTVLDLQPDDTPSLYMTDASGSPNLKLMGGDFAMLDLGSEGSKKHFQAVVAPGKGPYQILSDEEGFQTVIGSLGATILRTGETHTTSAASVVLLDKNKTVLWSAP